MSHFYAGIQGQRGEATRMGSKDSGIDGYVQSHDARMAVSMSYYAGTDRAFFTLQGGYSNYSGGRLALDFPQVNAVVNAVSQGDKKIDAIVERIRKDIAKLNEEAPTALKRIERRRTIEANRRQREQEQREMRIEIIRDGITDTERDNYVKLVRGMSDEERTRYYPDNDRIDQSICSGFGNIEPVRNEDNHLVIWDGDGWRSEYWDLTDGVKIEQDKEDAA